MQPLVPNPVSGQPLPLDIAHPKGLFKRIRSFFGRLGGDCAVNRLGRSASSRRLSQAALGCNTRLQRFSLLTATGRRPSSGCAAA